MGDFEIDAVLDFIISKGGRVRNHELVTHFKNFLNHPNNKAKNREKFKDYVNEVATIKMDEGEKVLVLKRKYRHSSIRSGSVSSLASTTSAASTASTAGSSHSMSQSSSSLAASASDIQPDAPEPSPGKSQPNTRVAPAPAPRDTRAQVSDAARAQSEPPAGQMGGDLDSSQGENDSVDGMMMSKARSDENMEVRMRNTGRVPVSKPEDAYSVTASSVSLASSGSQGSVTSSTSGVGSLEDDPNASVMSVMDKVKKLNKIHSETDLNSPRGVGGGGGGGKKSFKHGGEDDDSSHSSGQSYVTLQPEEKEWMVVCSSAEYHDMNRLLSKNPGLAKIKDFTNGYTALHWAAKFGKMEVIKLIANKPNVNIDQRSHGGYTALHLAAIHGHENVIELLVQTFKADANLRDYSGKKAKQYLKNSASSKAQQLLVSRRLGSELHPVKSLDDSFIRSASMRMSNRAKAMSSLLSIKSAVTRQPLLRSSWGGSTEDISEEKAGHSKTPPTSGGTSPVPLRRKNTLRDMDLMPPPSNSMMARRVRYSDRSKSSSRESLNSPRSSKKNDENQNMLRSESDPNMLEVSSHTVV